MDIINSSLTTNLTHDTGEPGEGEGVSLEDLLPTICQVFVTIFLGWLTGTLKIISPEGVKGLNIFVGKFSLPSLVFISLATLDFSTVNLAFLLGIFLSKLQIFLLTIFLPSYLGTSPKPRCLLCSAHRQTTLPWESPYWRL